MTDFYRVFMPVLDLMLVIVGIWAIAALTVELAVMKRKSRPRLAPTKRQGKFYNIIVTDGEEGRK